MSADALEDVFREIVDETGQPSNNVSSGDEKGIIETIDQLLEDTGSVGMRIDVLFRLKDQIQLQKEVKEIEPEPYFSSLGFLLDHFRKRQDWPSFEGRGTWIHVITLTKEWLSLSATAHIYAFGEASGLNGQVNNVARAALYFQHLGYNMQVVNGMVDFENEEALRAVCTSVEGEIVAMGGLKALDQIASDLSEFYLRGADRYVIARDVGMMRYVLPAMPYGYLLNVSLKHCTLTGSAPQVTSKAAFRRASRTATNLAALYNVQAFSQFRYIFMTADSLQRSLYELILYDNLFSIEQYDASHLNKLLRFVTKRANQDILSSFASKHGFSLENLVDIVQRFLDMTGETFYIVVREPDFEKSIAPIPVATVRLMVEFLSTRNFDYNRDFVLPHRMDAVDTYLVPLIRLDDGSFLMLRRSISSIACVESILKGLRMVDTNFDSLFGKYIEMYLIEELLAKKFRVFAGEYASGGGECDIVLEDERTLVFLEVKKKNLTRKARSGMDVHVFRDLGHGVIGALGQLTRTERIIRTDGELALKHKKLMLNGRQPLFIVLTFNEYDSLNDKKMFESMAEAMLNGVFHTKATEFEVDFEGLNDALRGIQDDIGGLIRLEPSRLARPFRDYWCLSFSLFLYVLRESATVGELAANLKRVQWMTTGRGNFLADYLNSKMIHDPAEDEVRKRGITELRML